MNEAISLMFWVVTFLAFASYLYFGVQAFTRIKKIPFRFFHHLPYELHDLYFDPRQRLPYLRYLLIVAVVSLFAYWEGLFVYPSLPISYVLLAIMTLFLFGLLSIFMFQPKRIETYLLMVTLYLVMAVAMLFFASYVLFVSPFGVWQGFLPWTTLGQGVFQLALLLNPTLKQWAVLEKVESGNEKPLYRRPTHFVMASTQWLTLANVLLWVVLTQLAWFIA
jgi:hypothetical protein